MNCVKVSHVERVQHTVLYRGEPEVLFIRLANHANIGCSKDIYSPGAKTPNEITVHGVFV